VHYVFNCPTCAMPLGTDAENDDQAVAMLMEKFPSHMSEAHPDQPMPENPGEMIRSQMMKKEDGTEGQTEEMDGGTATEG